MSFSKKPTKINSDTVDPSVYYYDEVYDEKPDEDLEVTSSSKEKKDKGSKYLDGMKEAAEKRKVDKEIRKFKRYARDRADAEKSGCLADNDVYITSSYREKIKEMKLLEEGKTSLSDTKPKPNARVEDSRHRPVKQSKLVETSVRDLQAARKKTLEQRRLHLRKLLVKRTVGQIFEDAVKRYRARRKISSDNNS